VKAAVKNMMSRDLQPILNTSRKRRRGRYGGTKASPRASIRNRVARPVSWVTEGKRPKPRKSEIMSLK
jgi:hypothetical protein